MRLLLIVFTFLFATAAAAPLAFAETQAKCSLCESVCTEEKAAECRALQEWCASRSGDLGACYNARLICEKACTDCNKDRCTTEAVAELQTIEEFEAIAPNLAIPIPGLTFTPVRLQDGRITSFILFEYVEAVFGWLLIFASFLTVVIIMAAGVRWMMARGDSGAITQAKSMISKALLSLALLLSIVAIVEFIDPRLTERRSLELLYLENSPLDLHPDGEEVDGIVRSGLSRDDLVPLEGENLIVSEDIDKRISPEALEALLDAAEEHADNENGSIVVVSAFRDPIKQAQLFYDNCLASGSCSIPTCNPVGTDLITGSSGNYELVGKLAGKTNRSEIIRIMGENAVIGRCPHTSSVAVDVYCYGSSRANLDVECTNSLTQTMINNGWCRISSEPWHFELDGKHVSRSCSTSNDSINYRRGGNSYTVGEDCVKWDYTRNTCRTR